MPRNWRAPSEILTASVGGGALGTAGAAARLVRWSAASVSPESSPLNNRLKKQRKAKEIRFKCRAPIVQDTAVPTAAISGASKRKAQGRANLPHPLCAQVADAA